MKNSCNYERTLGTFFLQVFLKLWQKLSTGLLAQTFPEEKKRIEHRCPNGYSSVPNRRVGRNKSAGGKILKKY